jgi:hypothetical protein
LATGIRNQNPPPVFSFVMSLRLVKLPVWVGIALAWSLGASSLVANTSANPYQGIATRNVFGLKPSEPQVWTPAPRAALPVVKLVGITTIGGRYALLKLLLPARPPDPAREESCVLAVGEREDPVELLEINESARSVTVNNSGTVMVLALEQGTSHPQTPAESLVRLPLPTQR